MKKQIVMLCIGVLMSAIALAEPVQAIDARIAPLGKVHVGPATQAPAASSAQLAQANPTAQAPTAEARSGEAIYTAHCAVCHNQGVAGAPKIGDAAAWSARKKGDNWQEKFLSSVKNGLNVMPAMGTCTTCSDAELQAAITYMLK